MILQATETLVGHDQGANATATAAIKVAISGPWLGVEKALRGDHLGADLFAKAGLGDDAIP